jgi:hypothetical protein
MDANTATCSTAIADTGIANAIADTGIADAIADATSPANLTVNDSNGDSISADDTGLTNSLSNDTRIANAIADATDNTSAVANHSSIDNVNADSTDIDNPISDNTSITNAIADATDNTSAVANRSNVNNFGTDVAATVSDDTDITDAVADDIDADVTSISGGTELVHFKKIVLVGCTEAPNAFFTAAWFLFPVTSGFGTVSGLPAAATMTLGAAGVNPGPNVI